MRLRRWLLRAVVPALLLSSLAAPFVANRLEPSLIQPTAQIMTFLLTGRYAEHTFTGGVPHIYYRRLGSSYPNPVYAAVTLSGTMSRHAEPPSSTIF